MNKIYLNGYIDVPKEALDRVNEALVEHIRLTHLEEGCEKFEVTPSREKSGRFDVREIFSSKESFEAHQARVQNSYWGEVTKGFERHYTVEEK